MLSSIMVVFWAVGDAPLWPKAEHGSIGSEKARVRCISYVRSFPPKLRIAARNYARRNGASNASIMSNRAAWNGADCWSYLRSKPLTWPFHASCGYGFE